MLKKTRISTSLSLQVTFEYLNPPKLNELQCLSRRYYNNMAPALLQRMHLWVKGNATHGYCVLLFGEVVRVFDGIHWTEVTVTEAGDSRTSE